MCPLLCEAQITKSVKHRLSVPAVTIASTGHGLLSVFTNIKKKKSLFHICPESKLELIIAACFMGALKVVLTRYLVKLQQRIIRSELPIF